MSGENKTVHCITCGSEEIVMANAVCTWDVSEQKWVYSENYDALYHCSTCGEIHTDYDYRQGEVQIINLSSVS